MRRNAGRLLVAAVCASVTVLGSLAAIPSAQASGTAQPAALEFRTLGQPTLTATTLASRCANTRAQFNRHDFGGGFATDGPTGIAISSSGRLFVADDGGHRVLSWPNADALTSCQSADKIIGTNVLVGPEAIAVDGDSTLYVADTLDHTVKIFALGANGNWALTHTLGTSGVAGNQGSSTLLNYPRGLAVDEQGRLFVADDDDNRVVIFDPPFANHEAFVDSIYAGDDGGLAGPKALAISGDSLFIADYYDHRVLRFTGPFDHPAQRYDADAVFTGVPAPVDLAIAPDGSLYVSDQGDGGAVPERIAVFKDAVHSSGATTPNRSYTHYITSALGMAIDASGRLFVSEYSAYRVLIQKSDVSTAPIDPAATAATSTLLTHLQTAPTRATGRVSIGQEMATFRADRNTGYYREFYQLHQQGLPTPQIMSSELSYLEHGRNPNAVTTMLAHAAAGGTVAIDWHPDNPIHPADYTVPLTNAELAQVTQPGSAAHTAWLMQLSRAATTLQRFATAGVPVLFRPLVEMNGTNFFWWADDGSDGAAHAVRQTEFRALWQSMVTFMENHGLHNLLYVYSAAAIDFGECAPTMDYYPGAALADVAGIDVYQEQLNLAGNARGRNQYQALVATGKPFGFPEFGQSVTANGTDPGGAGWDARILLTRIAADYPRTSYAIAWYSSFGTPNYVFGLSDVAHAADVLTDPSIEDIPFGG